MCLHICCLCVAFFVDYNGWFLYVKSRALQPDRAARNVSERLKLALRRRFHSPKQSPTTTAYIFSAYTDTAYTVCETGPLSNVGAARRRTHTHTQNTPSIIHTRWGRSRRRHRLATIIHPPAVAVFVWLYNLCTRIRLDVLPSVYLYGEDPA